MGLAHCTGRYIVREAPAKVVWGCGLRAELSQTVLTRGSVCSYLLPWYTARCLKSLEHAVEQCLQDLLLACSVEAVERGPVPPAPVSPQE